VLMALAGCPSSKEQSCNVIRCLHWLSKLRSRLDLNFKLHECSLKVSSIKHRWRPLRTAQVSSAVLCSPPMELPSHNSTDGLVSLLAYDITSGILYSDPPPHPHPFAANRAVEALGLFGLFDLKIAWLHPHFATLESCVVGTSGPIHGCACRGGTYISRASALIIIMPCVCPSSARDIE